MTWRCHDGVAMQSECGTHSGYLYSWPDGTLLNFVDIVDSHCK